MTTARPLLLSLAIAATLTGVLAMPSPVYAQEAATAAVAASDKAARLDELYEQYWEEPLKHNPLKDNIQHATSYNDKRPAFNRAQFTQQLTAYPPTRTPNTT